METERVKPERSDDRQSRIIDLTLGRVQPSNEQEDELLKQIKEAEKAGRMIDLPFD